MKKHLWAPWRIEYVLSKKPKHCVLCGCRQSPEKNLVVRYGNKAFVTMNLYPYNNGHVMICPYEHIKEYLLIPQETKTEIFLLLDQTVDVLKKVLSPDGFNIGLNIGKVAGAGIDEHLHWHVVPRWNGDTNFMPVVNHTKVQVEALEITCNNLRTTFDLAYPQ